MKTKPIRNGTQTQFRINIRRQSVANRADCTESSIITCTRQLVLVDSIIFGLANSDSCRFSQHCRRYQLLKTSFAGRHVRTPDGRTDATATAERRVMPLTLRSEIAALHGTTTDESVASVVYQRRLLSSSTAAVTFPLLLVCVSLCEQGHSQYGQLTKIF